MKKNLLIAAIFTFLFMEGGVLFAQNHALILDSAYIVLDSGTNATPIFLVIDQPSDSGIIVKGNPDSANITNVTFGSNVSYGGQYNFVKWYTSSSTNTGSYVFPFGIRDTTFAFTFNKTSTDSSNISVSTWHSYGFNTPLPGTTTDVAAISTMTGTNNPIERFWNIQTSANTTQANLTFSYLGSENTGNAGATVNTQNWNGTVWSLPIAPVPLAAKSQTTGVGVGGAYNAQTTFGTVADSLGVPWVLTLTSIKDTIIQQTNVLCNGKCTGTARDSAYAGTPPYTYSWNTVPIQSDSIATGLCAGKYIVTVTDAAHNTTTDSVTITQPNSALSATPSSIPDTCGKPDGTAIITPVGGTGHDTYSWSPSGGTDSIATGLTAGSYICIITDSNNCVDTAKVTVGGVTTTATATANPATIIEGDSTNLIGTGGGTYQWYATGLNSAIAGLNATEATLSNPYATPTLTATGTVTYCVVADSNACLDTACVTVTVDVPCGELFVPNAFHPVPGDLNATECIFGASGSCIKSLTNFAVYDVLGNQVYSTTDPTKCWDGTYNGQAMNAGVFVYYLEATLTNGQTVLKKGNITLVK